MFSNKKPVARICGNCKLFDPRTSECQVIILWEGEKRKLPMDADDACFYEEGFFDPKINQPTAFIEDVQEVKFWVEDDKGQKTDGEGIVKMEYPEGFFGDHDLEDALGLKNKNRKS